MGDIIFILKNIKVYSISNKCVVIWEGINNMEDKKEEEKSILDSDELNAIAMYGSSKVQ